MSSTRIRANEVQKTIEPVRQPGRELIRRQEQGLVQAVAPQVAYPRVQLNRNGLRPADLLALQRTVGNRAVQRMMAAIPNAATRRPNQTGLPDGLKSGVETLSGMSMDGVNVHYNSSQPAQLNALAYTQGSDIHVAPGQERHLPHEAWHVVQQAQGRVQPTMQMKDGVPVNDDQGLEREADVMGAKAEQQTKELHASRPAPVYHSQGAPAVQCIFVKTKKQFIRGESQDIYVPAEQHEDGAVDTKAMKFSERQKVRTDLARQSGNEASAALGELDKEMGFISKKIDEDEILALGMQLGDLTGERNKGPLGEESRLRLGNISFRVLRALEFLGGFDEADSDAIRFRVLLQKYLDQIATLDATALSKAVEYAERPVDLSVTAEDVAAYREDIAERGNWGGGAEATVIATAFNFRCRLLILDRQRRYVEVDTIGPANPRTRSLLNVGSHYAVVSNAAVATQPFDETHVLYDAPKDGDCLFWALHNVAADGAATVLDVLVAAPQQLDAVAFIERARQIVSAGLSPAQIQQTIIELRFSGGRAGVGPRLGRRMNLHAYAKDDVRKRLARTNVSDRDLYQAIMGRLRGTRAAKISQKTSTLETLLDAYEKGRKTLMKEPDANKSPKPENRAAATELADTLLEAFLLVAAENAPEVESDLVPSEGQDQELEARLRKESAYQQRRVAKSVTASPHHHAQLVITNNENEEFVMDRIGQLVPRTVHRGISEFNVAELAEEGFMYPTEESPIPKGSAYDKNLKKNFGMQIATAASGIGANKLKAPKEMLHVEGEKPSPFMSTTAIQGGTVNPKGETFGKSVYTIDLAYLPPTAIAATYTDRGLGYFLLSAFKGTSADKAALVEHARRYEEQQSSSVEARKVKPSTKLIGAEEAAQANPALSGKEWQALMDVIRTGEILISARIPQQAMGKAQ